MWVKTITYRRVKNLGNYQSETLEMTAELNPDDLPGLAFETLKVMVEDALGVTPKKEVREISF